MIKVARMGVVFMAGVTLAATVGAKPSRSGRLDCDWMEDWVRNVFMSPDDHAHFGSGAGSGMSRSSLIDEYGSGNWHEEQTIAAENYHSSIEGTHMGGEHPYCQ